MVSIERFLTALLAFTCFVALTADGQVLPGDPQPQGPCDDSCLMGCPSAGQKPDCNFSPGGPTTHTSTTEIVFDNGHRNVHTLDCTYRGFRDLLSEDGYVLFTETTNAPFTPNDFPTSGNGILAIVSPRPTCCVGKDCCACPPGNNLVFTNEEASDITNWVRDGGSLLLIIDHHPAHQVQNLLAQLGVKLCDIDFGAYTFRDNELVSGAPGTDGIDNGEVWTNRGVTFFIKPLTPVDAVYEPVLRLEPSRTTCPSFSCTGDELPTNGLAALEHSGGVAATSSMASIIVPPLPGTPVEELQGLAIQLGQGKIYISAEASMFTAQCRDTGTGAQAYCNCFGFQDRQDNQTFLLNIVHWLDPNL